jgi:hypothetical membrane protein
MQKENSLSANEASRRAKKKGTDSKVAGILFSIGAIAFILLTIAAEAIYPNFDLQNNAISDLAALRTNTMAIEETAILTMGVCWVLGAYFLFRRTARKGMLVLSILPGVGYLMAGVSPENVNLIVHSAGALIAFPFGAIAAILSYRVIKTPFKYFGVPLGALSLCATFVTFFGQSLVGSCGSCSTNSTSYIRSLDKLYLGLGGWESMIIFPIILWLIGFGGYLLSEA